MQRPRDPLMIRAYRAVALIMLVLVLVQAVSAGRFLAYFETNAMDLHRAIANVVSIVVLAEVILAFAAGFSPQLRLPAWTSSLVVLMIAQTAVGYAGRDRPNFASLHVPLGVLVFGVSMLVTVLAFFDTTEREAEP